MPDALTEVCAHSLSISRPMRSARHPLSNAVLGEPDPLDDPERAATQSTIQAQFRKFIDEELTEKQRTALLAGLGGMPLEAVAERMGANRNALYKLFHDARKRLKRRMEAEGLSPQDMLSVFGG